MHTKQHNVRELCSYSAELIERFSISCHKRIQVKDNQSGQSSLARYHLWGQINGDGHV